MEPPPWSPPMEPPHGAPPWSPPWSPPSDHCTRRLLQVGLGLGDAVYFEKTVYHRTQDAAVGRVSLQMDIGEHADHATQDHAAGRAGTGPSAGPSVPSRRPGGEVRRQAVVDALSASGVAVSGEG